MVYDGGSGPSTTASRWIHFEWRRHSRGQSHDANYARGGARAVRRGRGGGDLASLWRLAGGRSPQRTFGFGCARVTYMLLKIHVNAGISRLILHTFDKCVCRGRQSCSRGQLSALAVATCATCAGSRGRAATVTRPTCARCAGSRERAAWSDLLHRRRAPRATALKGAQRLLRVRRAPRATALEGGRGGRRGPRVDARVHHQPSEASGQQKRRAHAVSRAWLTRGE